MAKLNGEDDNFICNIADSKFLKNNENVSASTPNQHNYSRAPDFGFILPVYPDSFFPLFLEERTKGAACESVLTILIAQFGSTLTSLNFESGGGTAAQAWILDLVYSICRIL
ncbi:uncharacterized protein LOC110711801 [Chenopodium quinoa]|uniref:uncharacterized protein LOC110711801 n=1 Tax=Chenopodium quinoa TaxID=63459 RepID=UPI000B793D10|nr:uncharacterized protein LOC110711801 [Chenopodium quinoa]